ncbi:MAG: SCO family protein [Gemmatimonadota bacterium]|nr:SCO family protein [Gemmatimonadota bacterium]
MNSAPRKSPLSRLAIGVAVVAVVAWAVWRAGGFGGAPPRGELAILAEVPPFELVNQSGDAFGSKQLAGSVWIANFIFTRCPTVCPELSRRMADLRDRLRDNPGVHLVSFSVDPEYDSPEVLAKYAAEYAADANRWSFLTGSWESMREAVETGLLTSTGTDGGEIDVNSVLHGTRFVLVDSRLRIRDYCDVSEPDAFEGLIADARQLSAILPPTR